MPQFITSPLAQRRDKSQLLGWNGIANLQEAQRYGDIQQQRMQQASYLHGLQQQGIIRGFNVDTDAPTQAWLMPKMMDAIPEPPPAAPKVEEKKPVAEPAPAPAPALPEPPKEVPKEAAKVEAGMNYDLGRTGMTDNHFSRMNEEYGVQDYAFSSDEKANLEKILGYAANDPNFFKNNPIPIYSGTDATRVTKETQDKLKAEYGLDSMNEEQANYLLNNSRADNFKNAIIAAAKEKGLELSDEHFKITNYRGNKVHNKDQRFAKFGYEGEYDPITKTFKSTGTNAMLPEGMTNSDSDAMKNWKSTLDPKKAQSNNYKERRKQIAI